MIVCICPGGHECSCLHSTDLQCEGEDSNESSHVFNQFFDPQTIKRPLVSARVEKSWCGDQCSMVQALVFANLLLVFAGFGIWYYRDWIWTLFQRWFPKFKVSSSSTETRQNVRLGHMSNPEGSLEQQALVDPTVSQNHQVPDH